MVNASRSLLSVDVTVWGRCGESFASLAKKGQEVIIEGQLRRNDWESEDGQKHSRHFLKAESWQFTQYRLQEESTKKPLPRKAPKQLRAPRQKTPSKSLLRNPGVAHNAPGTNTTH
jgi:single-stranded DNA-binding protein